MLLHKLTEEVLQLIIDHHSETILKELSDIAIRNTNDDGWYETEQIWDKYIRMVENTREYGQANNKGE